MASPQDSRSLAAPPGAGAPSVALLPVLDYDAMLASAENDHELLHQLIEIFLAESAGLLAQIRGGVRERDPESIERAAHTLQRALDSFGARRASKAASMLEARGHEARIDSAATLIPLVEAELARACEALSDYLRDHSPQG